MQVHEHACRCMLGEAAVFTLWRTVAICVETASSRKLNVYSSNVLSTLLVCAFAFAHACRHDHALVTYSCNGHAG
jgi:hypothetical protein